MPILVHVRLSGSGPWQSNPRHLHQLLCRWLDADSRRPATRTPAHHAGQKPWAAGPARPTRDGAVLSVRLLDDALLPVLIARAAPGRPVTFGSPSRGVTWHGRVSGLARRLNVDWAWITAPPPPATTGWRFRLLTPATFIRKQRYHTTLTPTTVLSGLSARWLACPAAPPPPALPEDSYQLSATTVTIPQPFDLDSMPSSALAGRFTVTTSTEHACHALGQLARFAALAGIGAKTAYGYGAATVRPLLTP